MWHREGFSKDLRRVLSGLLLQTPWKLLLGLSLLSTQVTPAVEPPPASIPSGTVAPAQTPTTALPLASRKSAGQSTGGGMGGPGLNTPGYAATWYPGSSTSLAATELELIRQNLSGAIPVYKTEEDTLLLTGGVRNTSFYTTAQLPDTQRAFPDELWNINLGLMYLHKFGNGWSSGLNTTFGSASDKPFHSLHELNLSFLGFLQVPAQNERDAWLFSLMYSPVGNLAFPIPGLAYAWKPSEELQASLGLPFSLMWKPAENLTFNAFYVPLTNINARATLRLTPAASLYAGYEWLNEAYFLADRAARDDRFLALEQRLIGGLRWDVWAHGALDVNAGYAFDRYYGEGENQFSDLRDRIDVGSGPFLGAGLVIVR